MNGRQIKESFSIDLDFKERDTSPISRSRFDFLEEDSVNIASLLISENRGSSICSLDSCLFESDGDSQASHLSLSDLDLSDLDSPNLEDSTDKKKDKCLASFSFTLPSFEKMSSSNIWPSLSNTNDGGAMDVNENVPICTAKNTPQNAPFASIYELEPSAFDCPGLTSDEEDGNESCISSFSDHSDDRGSISVSLLSVESTKESPMLPCIAIKEDENDNLTPVNNKSSVIKGETITTNLDHIEINIKRYQELSYDQLKKVDIPNKSFHDPIVFNEIPFSNLLKYYKYDDHTKELFYDRLALMLYALSFVVKGTGESTTDRYETFFCSYYQITCKTFKEWTGLTFFEFMKSRYCSPYFRVVYDETANKYFVCFNESDKTFTRLGNEMVAVRKVNTEIFRRKLVGIERKLHEIEYKEDILQEKLKWLKILSYAPKDLTEIPVPHFAHNFQHYYKIKLDSKYLSSKFIRSSFSGVVKYVFPHELEFIAENGGSIKVLCDLGNAIKDIQEKINFLQSEEYRRMLNTRKSRLTGELPPPFQRRQSKAPRVWDIPMEEIGQHLSAEIQTPSHDVHSNQNLPSGVNRKNKPIYTGSNVLQSEDEASSEED
uniref:NARG2_C domain-containing protein n=1 Tax=Strongyloides papillosus TaxID=174720 RepID=A0A0N5BD55_STREA